MQEEGLDSRVIEKLNLPAKNADLTSWKEFVHKVKNPSETVSVALVGKYVEHQDAYKSITEALIHGGAMSDARVRMKWVQSDYLNEEDRKSTRLNSSHVAIS